MRASLAYDVSMDWLYGATDDWERSSRMHLERKTSVWMFHHVERRHMEQMQHLKRQYDQIEALERILREVIQAERVTLEAVERFMARPGFEEMRGGAPIAGAAQRMEKRIEQAEATLERIRRSLEFHRIDAAELAGD